MMKAMLIAGFVIGGAPAYAQQTVPKASGDPLQAICTGFLDQSGQGVAGNRDRLCSCLARETKGRLTEAEMKAYNRASQSGQAPSEAVMQKVLGIATYCLTQAR